MGVEIDDSQVGAISTTAGFESIEWAVTHGTGGAARRIIISDNSALTPFRRLLDAYHSLGDLFGADRATDLGS